MTIPPIHGPLGGGPAFRVPVLTAPVSTGVPPVIGDEPLVLPQGAPASAPGPAPRDDAPILLGGRLDAGSALPDTTELAMALEAATRAMQNGRAEQVLAELDAIWSDRLASDSPWYLRTAALQLLGRMDDAEQVMRNAIERLPRSAALLYLLGVYTAHRGQPEAARLASNYALALHPTEPLLWLQSAALSANADMPGTSAAILEQVQTRSPAFPAENWLATLIRLGRDTSPTPTPVFQRAIERLTPSGVPVIAEAQVSPAPVSTPTPFALTVLDTAVRYGLTLLESPTESARSATKTLESRETPSPFAETIARGSAMPATRVELPTWESIILVAGLVVIAVVPALRIPALMICGAMAMLIVSRSLR